MRDNIQKNEEFLGRGILKEPVLISTPILSNI